jgi:hypothetical protein
MIHALGGFMVWVGITAVLYATAVGSGETRWEAVTASLKFEALVCLVLFLLGYGIYLICC